MTDQIHIGLVGMAFPGLNLGEELCLPKTAELSKYLSELGYCVHATSKVVLSRQDAKCIGEELNVKEIDCIVVAVTTFISDYFVVELATSSNKPIFMWIVEGDLDCISLVAGPLCSAALKNINHPYMICYDKLGGEHATSKLNEFALACGAINSINGIRIGYIGGKATHMFSQGFDELSLKKNYGVNVVYIPIEEFFDCYNNLRDDDVDCVWNEISAGIGSVQADTSSIIESCKYYLSAIEMVNRYSLSAISLNCYPHLKAKICLAVSLLNDQMIAAGCEGSVLDTLLMYIAGYITKKPVVNADVLLMNYDDNSFTFSHCGAGPMSLAKDKCMVSLIESIETRDGLCVCYDTFIPGTVTFANLVEDPSSSGMRLSVIKGNSIPDASGYLGNPIRVSFKTNIRQLYDNICEFGSGVHFIGMQGDYYHTFELIAKMLDIPFGALGE